MAVVIDGMVILKLTFEKCILTMRVRFNRLRMGSKVTVCVSMVMNPHIS